MSTPLTGLCQVIVEETFGELAAQVFETLCVHGRLSLHGLSLHSRLTPRQVRYSLVVLLQQNIAVWSSDNNDLVFYEANLLNTYNLIRHGKILRTAEQQLGTIGREITAVLLQNGSACIGQIVSSILEKRNSIGLKSDKNPVQNGDFHHNTNGVHDPISSSKAPNALPEEISNEVRATALVFVKLGFLIEVHDSHFRPLADSWAESVAIQRREHGDKVRRADEAAFNHKVEMRLVDWQYSRNERENLINRMAALDAKVRRRAAPSANVHIRNPSIQDVTINPPNDSLVTWNRLKTHELTHLDSINVKLNMDKFLVLLRNEKLTDLVNAQIGKATSVIYDELLRYLSGSLLRCQEHVYLKSPQVLTEAELDYPEDHFASLRDVAGSVDLSEVDTRFALPRKSRRQHISKPSTRDKMLDESSDEDENYNNEKKNDYDSKQGHNTSPGSLRLRKQKFDSKAMADIADEMQIDENYDDENRNGDKFPLPVGSKASIVKQHLLLLAGFNPQLARQLPATHLRADSWTVDFAKISKHLRITMIDSMIQAKFGQFGMRLVRILREKGKLEQKHLSNCSLINHKTQLALLTALHTSGYLELQEVPKDSTRTPGKTLFLWFFDEKRCTIKMLEDIYKATTRALQRVRLESDKYRNVIEKIQRSDVQGNEDEMLTVHEKQQLANWHAIEDRLLTEVERLDDVVSALRDF